MRNVFVKQRDSSDCAAACLAMVCLHYKRELSIEKLRNLMGTDINGTSLLGLEQCAKSIGFYAQAVRVDRQGLLSDFTLPCIAHVIKEGTLSHFVVLFKINSRYCIIGDPGKALMKVPFDDFYREFTGALLLVTPSETETIREQSKADNTVLRFAQYLLPHKLLFVYVILASVILTILGIASSFFNKILLDEILPYKLSSQLASVFLVFLSVSIIQTLVSFIRQWMMIYLSQKIEIPIFLGYFEHVYNLPLKFFSTRKTGDILTRFSDAFTIKNVFTSIALTLVMDIVMAVATGAILYFMNKDLFVIIVAMVLQSIVLMVIFRYPYKKNNEDQMRQSAALNSEIIEGLQAVETIKSNSIEALEVAQIEHEYIRSLMISRTGGMLSNIHGSLSSALSTIGNLALMFVGISQVIAGELTLGSLMSFITLSRFFMSPIGNLVGLQLQIQEANISMKRISEILDAEPEENREKKLQTLQSFEGDICFDKITFRYGTRKPVLQDFSLRIPKGSKVAIVGSSGSGKSTIAKLLLKYYTPEDGSITIDGVDINEYSNESIRQSISYVPQSIELFSKSIEENIRICCPEATLEDVKAAAKKAEAHNFVSNLPRQYQTELEESGRGLSAGEKQRISIARAFLKDSSLWILDESTSSLDFVTENSIFDVIYRSYPNRTMLIIAHRLATIKDCDTIVVLDNGKIVEQGTHQDLLNKRGQYFLLWNQQQGGSYDGKDNAVTQSAYQNIEETNDMRYR